MELYRSQWYSSTVLALAFFHLLNYSIYLVVFSIFCRYFSWSFDHLSCLQSFLCSQRVCALLFDPALSWVISNYLLKKIRFDLAEMQKRPCPLMWPCLELSNDLKTFRFNLVKYKSRKIFYLISLLEPITASLKLSYPSMLGLNLFALFLLYMTRDS